MNLLITLGGGAKKPKFPYHVEVMVDLMEDQTVHMDSHAHQRSQGQLHFRLSSPDFPVIPHIAVSVL